jgi:hypothetical protein
MKFILVTVTFFDATILIFLFDSTVWIDILKHKTSEDFILYMINAFLLSNLRTRIKHFARHCNEQELFLAIHALHSVLRTGIAAYQDTILLIKY